MQMKHISRVAVCFAAILSLVSCSLPVSTPAIATEIPFITEPPGVTPAGVQVRFLNMEDGGSITATLDDEGMGFVQVEIQVSGGLAFAVSLEQDGLGVEGEARNDENSVPFIAGLRWYPIRGGGEYTLEAHALMDDKSEVSQTIHVTVTGLAELPPTPPPLDETAARVRVSELIQEEFGVSVPYPAVYRCDLSYFPQYSRWIGSAWYAGRRYYVDVYDDTHVAWSSGPYSDPDHIDKAAGWTYCKPIGHYKILVLFVDYENSISNPQSAIDAVPQIAEWMNNLYTTYAQSIGLASSPLTIEAEGVFIGPPPEPGELVSAAQLLSLAGRVAAEYDLIMEIDLDPALTFVQRYYPGTISVGGGLALQGCGPTFNGVINIYSNLDGGSNIMGALVMDFNHELSHLFGMVDNWDYLPAALLSPEGQPVDDWIPYPLLGWTDEDGDGVMELLDDTPYGTRGPRP